MPNDPERRLVAKLAHTGAIEELIAKGIEARHFSDPDCSKVWQFIRDHALRYKSSPSLSVLSAQFPDYRFEVVTDSLEYCSDEFLRSAKRRYAIEALRELAEAVDDPEQVIAIEDHFLERSRLLAQLVPAPIVGRFSQMKERIEDYKKMLVQGTLPGIPMGIPEFDVLTLGIQPHEFVSVAGWQGVGKSTLMQVIFFNAYLNGKTGLMFSLEMQKEAVFRKWDAMATHVKYMALKAGELGQDELGLWEKWAERAEQAKNDIIVVDDVGRCTVDRVYAEMVRYKPDLVGVDYVSLMHTRDGQQMWEKITFLTQALKQTARSLKIPIVAAAQTNIAGAESGAELSNIAYSRSIGQDSDIVLGLYQDEQMQLNKKMELRMLKNRDGPRGICDFLWDHETMRYEPWSIANLFKKKDDAAP